MEMVIYFTYNIISTFYKVSGATLPHMLRHLKVSETGDVRRETW